MLAHLRESPSWRLVAAVPCRPFKTPAARSGPSTVARRVHATDLRALRLAWIETVPYSTGRSRSPLSCRRRHTLLGMEYTNFIIDFVERTRCNLEHIEERARCGDDDDVYPVTQLWNSLLGLIVVLHEDHEQRLPATPMTELYAQGWPDITIKG